MLRRLFALLALLPVAQAAAQDAPAQGRCTTPDSLTVRGNKRVPELTVLSDAGLVAGTLLNFKAVQRSIRALYETGNFEQVQITCDLDDTNDKAVLVVEVKERPMLIEADVIGVERLSNNSVKDRVDLIYQKPLDPAAVATVVARIDSLYERNGYYLARVAVDTVSAGEGAVRVTFRVEEGRRLAISGIQVIGNKSLSANEIVGSLKTRPEGFWWFRKGEFDDDKYAGDLSERLPQLYAKRGFIDFRVEKDTLIIDREHGKALVQIQVEEGPRYKVGDFVINGNKHFSSEDINRFYPFANESRPVMSRVTDFIRRRKPTPQGIFDAARWEDSKTRIASAYATDGYIYANVRPVVERRVSDDSTRYVDLRWEVEERTPAIVNRVEIFGNDYTQEPCIRDQLIILPGQVFNQDALIRSYQSLGNLGFFETPIPPPDTRTANDAGDVDIIFRVKEKRTGNINFGASMGQGTGVGGFIGLDQPNLFGSCKRGSLQWQFGRYINDFNLSYSDPRIKQSFVSGTLSLYRSQARYFVADLGRSLRTGANLQIGTLVPGTRWTRMSISYGAENVQFGTGACWVTCAASSGMAPSVRPLVSRSGTTRASTCRSRPLALSTTSLPISTGGSWEVPRRSSGTPRMPRCMHRWARSAAAGRDRSQSSSWPVCPPRPACWSAIPGRSSSPRSLRWAGCSSASDCAGTTNSQFPRTGTSRGQRPSTPRASPSARRS